MKPGLRFLYLHTDDLSAARHFYSNLLGMDEFYFQEGDSVAYRCDALQFSIMLTKQPLPRPQGWLTSCSLGFERQKRVLEGLERVQFAFQGLTSDLWHE